MRILVTGGAGYVGSACMRWLLQRGHDAVAFDNLAAGNRGAVPEGRLVLGEIEDRAAVCAAIRHHGSEAVMHFAALASVAESVTHPELYYRVNVSGTQSVLDAMRETGVDRIVFSSTSATYAFDAAMPLREDSPQSPQNPYGKTKLAAEWMLEDYRKAHGIGCVVLRYFNASGADVDGEFGEDRTAETHLIPLVFQAALGRREHVQVFGEDWETRDGTCIRDYVHTDDLAQAHQLALDHLRPGERRIYNVGSGHGYSVREVIDACQLAVGRPIPTRISERRPGDPPCLIASPEKLERELGWKPQHRSIASIVETAWRWHERYPSGYASKAR
jgi:UDP-glucose 4-epimerase